jgi:hypothetical protein
MLTMTRPTHPNRPPKAAEGDRVRTYDGPGVVTDVYPDRFYGAPPMREGQYIDGGAWDGLAYVVECDNGNRTVFDRSRIERTPA